MWPAVACWALVDSAGISSISCIKRICAEYILHMCQVLTLCTASCSVERIDAAANTLPI